MNISTFFPLNIGVSGLQTAQQAEDVLANNIANANTPGYVQEEVQLGESNPYPPLPANDAPILNGQFGQGATVTSVTRDTNEFINMQDRANQGNLQMYQTQQSLLQQVEGITNEPSDNSLRNSLDKFFAAWQTLTTDPTNAASQQSVISQAQILGQTFQTTVNQLAQLQTDTSKVISQQFGQLNQYAQTVATLNNQIQSVNLAGENPNSLLNQRDTLLDKMSQLANITYNVNSTGTVDVSLGSQSLVTTSSTAPSTSTNLTNDTATLALATSGSIAGNAAGIANINSELTGLSSVLSLLANAVNTQQGNGVDQNGNAGTALFNIVSGTTTMTTAGATGTAYSYLTVPISFAPSNIASAAPGGGVADNTNAIAIANIQSDPTMTYVDGNGNSSTGTLDQLLSQVVTTLGVTTAGINSSYNTAQSLSQQSTTMRQSVSSVDLNEQSAKMIQFQNSYSAAAKFISVFNQMMQTLMGITQ
jgi:flagellar hook-associated protein 1 FlgK